MTTLSTLVGERYALRRGVYSSRGHDGSVRLMAWPHAASLGRLTAGQQAVLRRLADGPQDAEDLSETEGAARLVATLRAGGWLTVTVTCGGRGLYSLEPLRPPPPEPLELESDLVLSRFAAVSRDAGGAVVESPRAWCEVRVHDAAALVVLGELAGARAEDLLPGEAVDRLRRDLRWSGLAVPRGGEEDTELRLRQWSPHELRFHERSRLGYRGYFGDGYGRTFWARDTFDPVPARPEPFPGPAIELPRADYGALRRADPSLTTVLEDRVSVREHDDAHPISLDQLGEFLHRCARIRMVREIDGVEHTSRPYPSGGSVFELELYPVVRHAAGLDPGMYHYDAHDHRLLLVRDIADPGVRRLLRAATHSTVAASPPQVLLVVSARVGRLMWKYESMAYALVLKHVGVLYQTMYMVATAMGLAPCGLGGGDANAFAEATGRDPLTESSVGEFMLGSRHVHVPIWELGR